MPGSLYFGPAGRSGCRIIRSGSFPESVMLRHLKRLAHRQAERTQFGQRVLGIAMMHERPTGFFPEMPVLERVIDEDVASLGMAALVHSHAGDRKSGVGGKRGSVRVGIGG